MERYREEPPESKRVKKLEGKQQITTMAKNKDKLKKAEKTKAKGKKETKLGVWNTRTDLKETTMANRKKGTRGTKGESFEGTRKKETKIKLGTWNVRSIFESGALTNIISISNKYDMEILALQETHLKGNEITELGKYTLFTSGSENRRYGVGFLIKENIRPKIIQFQPENDRLCYITIKDEKQEMTIVNIHAPTEDKDEEVKDQYYEKLTELIEKIPTQNAIIIIGDANAKIGREDIYSSITGGGGVSTKTAMKMAQNLSH